MYMEICPYPRVDCISGRFHHAMKLYKEKLEVNEKGERAKFRPIPMVTFKLLFEMFRIKEVDLLSVDCEGCEEEILNLESPAWLEIQGSVHWIIGEWEHHIWDGFDWDGYHFSSHLDLLRKASIRLKL